MIVSLARHDIGRILGCMLVAEGIRETTHLAVHLIQGHALGDIPFLWIILAFLCGVGLYLHWAPARLLVLLLASLGELFVAMIAVEVPVKIWLGTLVFPVSVAAAQVQSYVELYALLAIFGFLFAAPIYLLLTAKANQEFGRVWHFV